MCVCHRAQYACAPTAAGAMRIIENINNGNCSENSRKLCYIYARWCGNNMQCANNAESTLKMYTVYTKHALAYVCQGCTIEDDMEALLSRFKFNYMNIFIIIQ